MVRNELSRPVIWVTLCNETTIQISLAIQRYSCLHHWGLTDLRLFLLLKACKIAKFAFEPNFFYPNSRFKFCIHTCTCTWPKVSHLSWNSLHMESPKSLWRWEQCRILWNNLYRYIFWHRFIKFASIDEKQTKKNNLLNVYWYACRAMLFSHQSYT